MIRLVESVGHELNNPYLRSGEFTCMEVTLRLCHLNVDQVHIIFQNYDMALGT